MGALSPSLEVKTVDNLPAPTNFRVVSSDQSSCTLGWDAPSIPTDSEISGYQVQSDSGKQEEFKVVYDGQFDASTREVTLSHLI